jgi:hypothetical protein
VISPSQRLLPWQQQQKTNKTNIHALSGILTVIPGIERPQTYALDRTANEIGSWTYYRPQIQDS